LEERWKKSEDQIKVLMEEVDDWRKKFEWADQTLNKINDEANDLEAKLEAAKEDKTRSESELEQTKHKLVEEQDARRKLEETCRKSEDKIKVLLEDVDDWRKKFEWADETLNKINDEANDLEAKLEETKEDKTRLESELEQTKCKLLEASQLALPQDDQDQCNESLFLQTKIQQLGSAMTALREENNRYALAAGKFQHKIQALEQQVAKESRNFEKIRRQLIVEQEDLRELEERWKKSEDQIKVLMEEVDDWRKKFEWADQTLNKINDEANDLEAKLEAAKEDKTRSESELEQTKHKLVEEQDARRKLEETCRKSEDKIKVLLEDVDDWRKKFEWADETLNKINDEANDLEAKLEETKEDKTRLESELEQTKCKLLEASQLALPQDDQDQSNESLFLQTQIQQLGSAMTALREENNRYALAAGKFQRKIQALEQQVAAPDSSSAVELNNQKQLITGLQEQLEHNANLVQTLKAELVKKDEEMVAQEQLMDKLEAEHKARVALERALKGKEAENAEYAAQVNAVQAELKRLEKNASAEGSDENVKRVHQQLADEREQRKDFEDKMKQFEDKVKYWEEEADDWKKKFEWANETLDKINDEANDLEAKLEAANEDKARLESELEAEKTKKMAAATTSTPSEREHELEKELGRVREKLGAINVKYADLKVDVDREELELQKRCKRLQEDLDYERKNVECERHSVARLTNSLRILQSEKMETTVLSTSASARRNKAVNAATNTEQACSSPQWSSGPGYLKEVRLYELEHKTRRLEKENKELKTSEDYYKKRGSEYKTKAVRYEEQLIKAGVVYKKVDLDAPRAKPDQEGVKENCQPAAPADNMADLDLELIKQVPPRDLRLPKTDRREQPNDCKTQ